MWLTYVRDDGATRLQPFQKNVATISRGAKREMRAADHYAESGVGVVGRSSPPLAEDRIKKSAER